MTDLLTFIPLLLFNCLWCVGFNAVTWCEIRSGATFDDYAADKMLLWPIRFYAIKWFGEWYSKPICTCLPCMGSIHSLWFWAFNPLSLHSAPIYILYAIALAGLNKIVMVKFDL